MDGRNEEATNNQYELQNREQSNQDDVLSISEQVSGNKEEEEE